MRRVQPKEQLHDCFELNSTSGPRIKIGTDELTGIVGENSSLLQASDPYPAVRAGSQHYCSPSPPYVLSALVMRPHV